jgi:hypothetical protein
LLASSGLVKVGFMKRLLIVVFTLLVACKQQPEPTPLQVILVSSDFALDEARLSFALYDGTEVATTPTGVSLTAFPVGEEVTAPAWQGEATNYTDYLIPYWVAYPELPAPGFWGFIANITLADGRSLQSQFTIELQAESKSPPLGTVAPASQNRTLATEPDLSKLSSGPDANPALYQMTVAEAIRNGRPTVVGFITPGLCQTQWCTPVLETVEAVRNNVGDEAANFIHVEVYEDFQNLTLVKEMAEWGLDTEPWVFVLAEDGRVAAKFNGPLSPQELTTALNIVRQ